MQSAIDPSVTGKAPKRSPADIFEIWNRKVHFYLGLYFLFFLWLFAFTGILLNHSHWKFQEFWPNRKISNFERQIQPPPPGSDLEQAKDLMRQLGLSGEIGLPIKHPAATPPEPAAAGAGHESHAGGSALPGNGQDPTQFDFTGNRPGHGFRIIADLRQGRAKVEAYNLNIWGTMRILHTFTGVRLAEPGKERNWVLTTVWALSMDALALGLIVMSLGSLYMWWCLKKKRNFGFIALVLGLVSCGYFMFVLRWLL